ncbi:hypothetical protein TREMEDRAFT_67823 [Tremella mesenterica DSM 1558]|uniref:uncharacterized protein n=1 Tax=Tremella mesenterica (strain ATCC 24925 / CBS 8224 / DSM 1558 / NBRC 9311 / NRRL Y-6157 / RJB 2259-6 / UBC 559-6) TaxID=578456 RepID=UPI0003F49014|nr:uncharacterized protein TREMEDRAFT_67823 [Tremella mesenterica DSM 1558]EIW71538.1 hypothetical protein TREMEDRAFT_67823 [Tremella mesenterica DSM 1558]
MVVKGGAICSEHSIASEIGKNIFAQGGNAVDAIIATSLSVGVLNPFNSDIGGGGFALLRLPNGEHTVLDFRHVSPAAATSEMYRNGASTSIGGTSVCVPGEIAGFEELHQKYGQLEWEKVLEPVIKLCEGYQMGGDLYRYLSQALDPLTPTTLSGWLSRPEHSDLAEIFFQDDQLLSPGSILRRPILGQTLRKIAERGSDVFYNGEIGQEIVRCVRGSGGLMILSDLSSKKALKGKYRKWDVYSIPAPGSGAVFLSALGVLGSFPSDRTEGKKEDAHRMVEVQKLAYAQRTLLGDPDFVPSAEKLQRDWLSPEGIQKRANKIDKKAHEMEYYLPETVEIKNDHGTSHIITADSTGLIVSLTTTIGHVFGSRVVAAGMVLNDSMDDFSVEGRVNSSGYTPSPANYVQPGKRSLSSMCPYIVELDGKAVLAGGCAGGSTIISTNIQIVRNVLEYGMSPDQALAAGRIHSQLQPSATELERSSDRRGDRLLGISEDVAADLEGRGHEVVWAQSRSVACTLGFDLESDWTTGCEPRREDSGGAIYVAS